MESVKDMELEFARNTECFLARSADYLDLPERAEYACAEAPAMDEKEA